jgi:Flp pilus assembly protein TadG
MVRGKTPLFRRARMCLGNRSGATATEFAIILPVLVLTIMGIIEFGHLFWNQVSLKYAVEQTARNAMAEYTRESFVNSNFSSWYANWTPSLEAAVPNEVFGWDPSGANFTAATASVAGVEYLTIDAAYTYQFVFFVIPGVSSIGLTASTTTPLIGDWS